MPFKEVPAPYGKLCVHSLAALELHLINTRFQQAVTAMKKFILLIVITAVSATSIAQEKDQVAEENFRKAITAAGGEDRLNTIKAPTMWMETGTYYGVGEGVPFVAQYASYWPKRWYRQMIEGKFAIGVAGDQLTLFTDEVSNGTKLSGAQAEGALYRIRVAWAQLLYPFTEDEYKLSNIPGVDVEGKPTIGIKAEKSGSAIMLYFDKSTFLLTKTEAMVAAPEMDGKLVTSETFYTDHKPFGDAKLPSKYKILYDGKLMVESETTAIKTHATIDPAWFGVEGPSRVR